MRVFKTRWFAKFARRERIADTSLLDAIARAERGIVDADLGGGLIKQRVARAGQGRSGGYRTILAYRIGDRAVFLFGFAKHRMDDIGPDELRALRASATQMLEADPAAIDRAIADDSFQEIAYDEEPGIWKPGTWEH